MKNKKANSFNIGFSAILLGAFLVFLVSVILWESNQSELPTACETQAQPSEAVQTDPLMTIPTMIPTEATQPYIEPRRINFLLVGRDWHSDGENGRSDTMILCSVDSGTKTVTMISFLRDIYLEIPGHGFGRMNASYSWGGAELLKETLEHNFGVSADVSLEIDFDGFENMIDYLRGVDVELSNREAEYLNENYGWTLTEGINHLNGSQALAYTRIRYIDSDFVRTERQRNVLISLMKQYKSATLQEMLRATDEFLEQSTSDHTDEELLAYAYEFHTMLSDYEIITHRVPADGTYSYDMIRGMSVIQADLEANRDMLNYLLNPEVR